MAHPTSCPAGSPAEPASTIGSITRQGAGQLFGAVETHPQWERRKQMKGKALMLIRTTIVSVSVATAAALGTSAHAALRPASAHATQRAALATTIVKVTTFNSSFHVNPKTVPRGVVIFKITNKALFPHEFSINGQTSKVLKKGQSTTLRVTFSKPGHYVYKDPLHGHVQWGDIGGFFVT
jgi:plastocyanin